MTDVRGRQNLAVEIIDIIKKVSSGQIEVKFPIYTKAKVTNITFDPRTLELIPKHRHELIYNSLVGEDVTRFLRLLTLILMQVR